jgi:Zn ribbon nucleic-acid-binding protein
MTVDAILATVAELGERHELLTIFERDGVDIVRCEACGHAVVVGA